MATTKRGLVIGGTGFLGRHLTEAARSRGWTLTLLNRGIRAPDHFPDLDTRLADRDGGLDVLGDDRWDAVWDTCGYLPRVVRASAARLADRVEHYTFVSTVSVYPEIGGTNEEATELTSLENPDEETVSGETYGGLKAACEHAVTSVYGARSMIVRPGLIVGPHDHTDRLAYWPMRVARGGNVLAPGDPGTLIQIIDVRDLAEWMVHATEGRLRGAYNAVGPATPLSMGDFLAEVCRVVNPAATLVWVPNEALLAAEVSPWTELPLWIPGEDVCTDGSKATAAGLRHRPLADTIAATHAWLVETPRMGAFADTLDAEVEAALVSAHL